MKILLFCFVLQFITFNIYSQISNSKPVLDTADFHKWESVEDGTMNSTGEFISYIIRDRTGINPVLVLKSVSDQWEVKFSGVYSVDFLNGNIAVFQRGDSLCILKLGAQQIQWITKVKTYSISRRGSKEFLVYLRDDVENTLSIRETSTNEQHDFWHVVGFSLWKDNVTLFLVVSSQENNSIKQSLFRIRTDDCIPARVWSTTDTSGRINLGDLAYDTANDRIAFTVGYGDKPDNNVIWIWSGRSNEAHKLADLSRIGERNMVIAGIAAHGFSYRGDYLFIVLKKKRVPLPKATSIGVDIWSYKDARLQSRELYDLQQSKNNDYSAIYTAALSIQKGEIIPLTTENESVAIFDGANDSLGLIWNWGEGSATERNWNPASRSAFYFVSTRSGIRRKTFGLFWNTSTGGKYLYGYDSSRHSLYLFNPASGLYSNISSRFPEECRFDDEFDEPGMKPSGLKVAGWLKNDSMIIVYDKYDIWKVDPKGKGPAVNLTFGFGRLHHIEFRLIGGADQRTPIADSSTYMLDAFDLFTMETGFYTLGLKKTALPEKLIMGHFLYRLGGNPSLSLYTNWLRSGQLKMYLIRRERASEAPNYFLTKDFKEFSPVSAIYPENEFNWMTAEVIHWRDCHNRTIAGVIYKPEDFDYRKKYPVIINYYEKLAQHVNEYKRPDFAMDNINIPWFVSRGYIVFTPDIHFEVGQPGRSTYCSVVSGTNALLKYPWIDSKKIALQGHSWGGYETNYIVTHSSLYCAALSASSITDLVSDYGSLMNEGDGRQFFYEIGQIRMGTVPWARVDLYVENSPVFFVKNVHTPLLLMANKGDGGVPFDQSIEFFTALRRLGRKVWLLQYDGEDHSVHGNAAVDYTLRMTQFFDYFCKGTLSPEWMTTGIPANLKGVDRGFEPDSSGRVP